MKVADRVKETTTTTGMGALTLGGASEGYRAFSSVFAQGQAAIPYCVAAGAQWEVGEGTLSVVNEGAQSWTTRTSGFGTTGIYGVTYGNGLFVAVGDTGKLATSPDGITWTTRTSGFGTTSIQGVTYGNGLFVAVGDSGTLTTSPDGITWTTRTSGFGTTGIYGVTYGNGLFVAGGNIGTLTTSPDGITWTSRTSGFGSTYIWRVTYGNGLFVAVGGSGTLTTSPDGITWTSRTSGFGTTGIQGVTYGNGLFVAVGDSGKLFTSPDNITGSSISRTTVLSSSNANALVNFSAGTKDVFCTLPANRVFGDGPPAVLTNGAAWIEGSALKVRIGGVTKTVTLT